MRTRSKKQLLDNILHILFDPENGSIPEKGLLTEGFELVQLTGDGSNRQFYRVSHPDFSCIAAVPPSDDKNALREAQAAFAIGQHLYQCSTPVPEMFGYDHDTGIVLYEDLGGTHLYDLACSTDFDDRQQLANLNEIYEQVLEVLVFMQVKGKDGFNGKWCWDTPLYDKELMLHREAGYFYQQCWLNLLGMTPVTGIENDFLRLAQRAGRGDCSFFLHRDFQSRNVMIKDNKVRIIDFQGGRFGPLGYDVASLLLDPYTSLPAFMQDSLLEYYLKKLQQVIKVDIEEFYQSFRALSLQRNLQIIGAFCYLGMVRQKTFFRPYIRPSLENLYKQLTRLDESEFPVLTDTVEQALSTLSQAH
ncbi:aminoglycoside phosphotransferase family protein [Desulfopila sp. IMCC35008]|uniref:aminoglycoside phosphotransferase family protein n=1 Tax=Desulfopila sp. IMCC35008 TaxID=2653858 RepID=UPI0013D86D9A|nr:phosphotransferase [Desulfopila sp. IMCC35008]